MTHPLLQSAVLTAAIVLSSWVVPLAAETQAASGKPVIEKRDDLPRHSYSLTLSVAELLGDNGAEAVLELATAVEADLRNDLANFDIRDASTQQEFYATLGTIAALRKDWSAYLDYLALRRALETKEANRLTLGLVTEALAEARLADERGIGPVMARFDAKLAALPFARVASNLEALKGSSEILSESFLLGSIEARVQPQLDRTGGEIGPEVAATLLNARFTLTHYLPLTEAVAASLGDYLASQSEPKADIWAERNVMLDAASGHAPVVIAIWDSGVDTRIFAERGQLWVNGNEIPGNALDDDDNGVVDDRHGIAYDLDALPTTELLYPIGTLTRDEVELRRLVKGLGDIQFNVDSEEASVVRKRLGSLGREEVEGFLESLGAYGNYAHGTHVAGIATEGNPFARVLVARMTYGHTVLPEKPTLAGAHREAAMFLETVAYFRAQGVRVVNMSWGGSLASIERALEANGVGDNPEERKAFARELFNITDGALRRAILEAPEILFVTSAGNSDNDVRFDEFYPSSYDFPNVLTVGAVDSAGDETSFTSLGKVDVYGNGFEVESDVPGGARIAFNGTSMSSPQVTNLAAKLLALRPELSVEELRRLIIEGAEEKVLQQRTIRLLNPRRSLELASD